MKNSFSGLRLTRRKMSKINERGENQVWEKIGQVKLERAERAKKLEREKDAWSVRADLRSLPLDLRSCLCSAAVTSNAFTQAAHEHSRGKNQKPFLLVVCLLCARLAFSPLSGVRCYFFSSAERPRLFFIMRRGGERAEQRPAKIRDDIGKRLDWARPSFGEPCKRFVALDSQVAL